VTGRFYVFIWGHGLALLAVSEHTQISIKTFRNANGVDVCRPPQRSPKHHESFTNEQLCSLHRMTVGGDKKA
jgi:hypothetical protein